MRDPAFALLPVSDRADRTVAWLLDLPLGSTDGAAVLERVADTDDLLRLGGGRPLLLPIPASLARSVLARPVKPGLLVPLIDSDTVSELDPALLRRAPGATTAPSVGVFSRRPSYIPPRAWARAWCVVPDAELKQWQAVASTGVVTVLPGGETRAARRTIWQIAQAHVAGPPLPAALVRDDDQVQALLRMMRVLAQLAEGRGGATELEALAEADSTLSKELQHAVASSGVSARPTTGGAAATVAMRVLGRDPILHRLAAVIARRSGDLSAMPDLSPQLLVRAALAQECVLGDSRGQHAPMAYAAGLLSMLDVVIAQPVAALLDRLALGPLMQQALLDRTGPVGDALDAADAIANGWWADAASRRPIEQMGAMVREAWRTARRDLIALRTT
jgi:hypothetical protein